MSRWLYSYESSGSRALTDAEAGAVEALLARLRRRKTLQKALTLTFLFGIFGSIVVACLPLLLVGVPLVIACIVGMTVSNNSANKTESAVLLYARAFRMRRVETFVRSEVSREVRHAYAIASKTGGIGEGQLWLDEEQLISKLTRLTGTPPQTIETLDQEGVVLLASGRLVPGVIEVKVADLDANTIADCPVDVVGAIKAAFDAAGYDPT